MPAILVITTAPDLKTAQWLAKSLVQKKLAACVSFKGGFTSFYRWKGKIDRAREAVLFIKSSRAKFAKIKQHVCRVHPYEVPELIAVSISRGSSEYLAWLAQSLK